MLSQRLANIVFAIFIIVACIYFAAVAQGFEAAGLLATSGLPSKFFPQLMLAGTALCAVIVGIGYALRRPVNGQIENVFNDIGEARRGLLTLMVAVVCYVLWSRVGFISMVVLMGPLCLMVMGIRSIKLYVAVLLMSAIVYVLFTQLLGVQLK